MHTLHVPRFRAASLVTAIGAVVTASLCGAAPANAADCRAEVTAAFEKQRTGKTFRMEASVIGPQGPMKMTVDYGLPDRLRQKVLMMLQQQTVEAVLVGKEAWVNEGQGWSKAPDDVRAELDKQLSAVAEETADQMVQFDCMGNMKVDGQELAAYRAQEGPKDMSPDAADKPKPNDTVRVIYVDPATGLPARSVVARPDKLDKPLFKAVYTYPSDIKIEPPK